LGVKWAVGGGGGGGAASGEGNPTYISGFGEDNLAASLTNSQLYRVVQGVQSQIPVVASHAGAVIGLSVASSEARTAGTATFEVYLDGVATGLQAVLDATDTQYAYAVQGGTADPYDAGAQLDVRVTTDGSWTPTTADVEAAIIVADDASNVASWSPILDYKPTTDTVDDEFDSGTLDAKWTAVTGSSGTVALDETAAIAKYDLSTRSGWLLLQSDTSVELRQDFSVADSSSLIVAVGPPLVSHDGEPGITGNEMWFGLTINDNDTGHDSGNYLQIRFDTVTNGYRILTRSEGGTIAATSTSTGKATILASNLTYLRITREGTAYRFYYSYDGSSWTNVGSTTDSATFSNVWLWIEASSPGDPTPIWAVDWIRQGTNALDPWSHSGLVELDRIVTRVKTADESVTSSVTLQDDDELLFPVGVNETWIMDAYLATDGATAGDIQVAVKGPTGVGGIFSVEGPGTGATTATDLNVNNQVGAVAASPTGLVAGTLGAGTDGLVRVHAVIRNGSTAGDAVIQWAQGTSSGTATQVLTDSYLTAVKH
jgi:hypothetical protein